MPARGSSLALRLLVVAALLAAQQVALSHQVWHLGRGAGAPTSLPSASNGQSQPPNGTLCEFHDSMGAVLGALSCAIPVARDETCPEPGFAPVSVAARRAVPLKPSSRDPPRLA
jgi:hypothetical protein